VCGRATTGLARNSHKPEAQAKENADSFACASGLCRYTLSLNCPDPREMRARLRGAVFVDQIAGHFPRFSPVRRPFGGAAWTLEKAQELGLEWTIRPRGRPKNEQMD